jgi:hypothetical protein
MGTKHTMRDTNILEELVQSMILAPPFSLYMQYLSIQETLNMFLELKKYVEHIGLALKKVKPSKTAISINKTNIIFMSTSRGLSVTPNIRIYNLK